LLLAFPNPVHRVLEICGVSLAMARDVFIEVEGLNTIKAFGALSGDANVTEMAKRMASCTANSWTCHPWNHADQAHSGLGLLGQRIMRGVRWTLSLTLGTRRNSIATLARKEADQNFEKLDIDIVDPGKCQTDFGWDAWQIAFTNKLSVTMGAAKVPLASM
jgi:hypothetical protein